VFYESFDINSLDSSFTFLEWYDEDDLTSRTYDSGTTRWSQLSSVPRFVESVEGRYTEVYSKKYDQKTGIE
jgi:hypothetical protein